MHNRFKTHCPRGHEYTPTNTLIEGGRRKCKQCKELQKGWAIPSDVEDAFWPKVDKTPGHGPQGECWLWIGAKHEEGYGLFRRRRAHRFSYELHNNSIDAALLILHSCDNPPCVNPAHLSQGTSKENTDDKMRKGRHKHGYGPSGAKGVCRQGHAIVNQGGRREGCKICRLAKRRERYKTVRELMRRSEV